VLSSFGEESKATPVEAKLEVAKRAKEEGNALFKAGRYDSAADRYRYCTELHPPFSEEDMLDPGAMSEDAREAYDKACEESGWTPEVVASVCDLKYAAKTNLSNAMNKLQEWSQAAAAADEALKYNKGGVKAIFRHAQAMAGANEYAKAREDLRKVLELEPGNRDARAMLVELKERKKADKDRDKATYSRMLTKQEVYADVPVPPPPMTMLEFTGSCAWWLLRAVTVWPFTGLYGLVRAKVLGKPAAEAQAEAPKA